MKKVFFVCMTAGLFATSCDWFKSKPTETIVETPEGDDSTTVNANDTSVQKTDSTVAIAETETKTKKEVKK